MSFLATSFAIEDSEILRELEWFRVGAIGGSMVEETAFVAHLNTLGNLFHPFNE